MRPRSLVAAAVGVLLILGVSSGLPMPTHAQQVVPSTCLFTLTVDSPNLVAVGQHFAVVLNSDRTTGFSWALSEDFTRQTAVELVSHQYVPSPVGRVGAGGKECWIFRAVHPGTVTITLNYARPWEHGVPPAETAPFEVTVGS